jgi:hypothetical protein
MNIFFNFVKFLNKNYMFKTCLNIFIEIQKNLTLFIALK